MGVTFRPDEDFPRFPVSVCLRCGLRMGDAPTEKQADCMSCFGYGGDSDADDRHFALLRNEYHHVDCHMGNTHWILCDILDMSDDDDSYCGSLDAETFLSHLNSYEWRRDEAVVEPRAWSHVRVTPDGVSDGPTVYTSGRSAEQVDRKLSALRSMCEYAIERGVGIVWG